MDTLTQTTEERIAFFRAIFRDEEGYICLTRLKDKKWNEQFYLYPDELPDILKWIDKYSASHNVYFCPQLLADKRRVKNSVKNCMVLWADLDNADYTAMTPEPSIVVESSPGRYHGYWMLDEATDPRTAEDASHRIAYHHRDLGVDQSGWDLTQVLRPPKTFNLKYSTNRRTPVTRLIEFNTDRIYPIETFQKYLAPVPGVADASTVPELKDSTLTFEDVFSKWKLKLPHEAISLIETEQKKDWSKALWKLECLLFEIGMTEEEAFILAKGSQCNKYERDGRGDGQLWSEIHKARQLVLESKASLREIVYEREGVESITFLTEEERPTIRTDYITDEYVTWAKDVTDADPSFHTVGSLMVLSAILSGALRITTSDKENLHTNLWALILADTTVARKTTSMNLAVDFVKAIVPEVYLATDGSYEGILSAMSLRPSKPSMFLRDEFSGFLAGIQNVRYQSGMAEAFIKMFDGSSDTRLLRRETISLVDPIFLFYTGGAKSKIYEMADPEMIRSGFFPRFIVTISDDVPRSFKSRRPVAKKGDDRANLMIAFNDIHDRYSDVTTVRMPDGTVVAQPKTYEVTLTDECWDRFDEMYLHIRDVSIRSPNRDILSPTLERLSENVLKVSALLAASRQKPPQVVVEMQDLLKAMSYAEKWGNDALELCARLGYTMGERKIEAAFEYIKENPGVLRGALMQRYRMLAKDADILLDTLEQRGLITRKVAGKGERLYANP